MLISESYKELFSAQFRQNIGFWYIWAEKKVRFAYDFIGRKWTHSHGIKMELNDTLSEDGIGLNTTVSIKNYN